MVNGLAVLGWGVGGIEAEAAMLGQPVSMLIPEVVGFKLTGALPEGSTATDLVLTVTQMLRKKGVVGKFVEFFGPGVGKLPLADRATIGNMAPEYGATCGFFPIDEGTLDYLRLTGRARARRPGRGLRQGARHVAPRRHARPRVHRHARARPRHGRALARRPKRPQDRVALRPAKKSFEDGLAALAGDSPRTPRHRSRAWIMTCPRRRGDRRRSPAAPTPATRRDDRRRPGRAEGGREGPDPQALGQDLAGTGLARGHRLPGQGRTCSASSEIGFDLVGYGCTTCIGNSGPLPDAIGEAVTDGKLVVAAVLSGNRNFEGRVHAQVKANYLASPPLVVAYALAGSMLTDITTEPLGTGKDGKPVYPQGRLADAAGGRRRGRARR